MTSEIADAVQNIPQLKGCPYFALLNDPDTSLLFPSSMGYCHHAHPPAPVKIAHQEAYCLTSQHATCPVFAHQERRALPTQIQGEQPEKPPRRGVGLTLFIVVVVLAVVVPLGIWGGGLIGNRSVTREPEIPTRVVAAAVPGIALTATALQPTVMDTATAVPTRTPAPTHTATPLPTTTSVPTPVLPSTFTPVPPPANAIIQDPPVNVYTGPDTSYPIFHTIIQSDARFSVVAQFERGGWWQICCVNNGDRGWVAAADVEMSGDATDLPMLPAPTPQVNVLASRLNVRSGPGIDYPLVGQIEEGEVFSLVGRLNDSSWWEVCCIEGTTSGWVIDEGVEIWGYPDVAPVATVVPLPVETAAP